MGTVSLHRILIVGIGALGGTIATRAVRAGMPIWLATRTAESAAAIRSSGLRVSGVGGTATVGSLQVAAVGEYAKAERFDLILVATKAHDALEAARFLSRLLVPNGVLLPIQNGSVPMALGKQIGGAVLGGISNLGATMHGPGIFEQRNAGHLLIGEPDGGGSERAEGIADAFRAAVEVRTTPNFADAVWAKLLLNCSVTTIGAIAAQTMRQYIASEIGKQVFRETYDEALAVAQGMGLRPQRMIVDPIPPGWKGTSVPGEEYEAWISQILAGYGDVKPSMLQDFERHRLTEIDFINGYVAKLGRQIGVPTPMNVAITHIVHRIEKGGARPHPELLEEVRRLSRQMSEPFAYL